MTHSRCYPGTVSVFYYRDPRYANTLAKHRLLFNMDCAGKLWRVQIIYEGLDVTFENQTSPEIFTSENKQVGWTRTFIFRWIMA